MLVMHAIRHKAGALHLLPTAERHAAPAPICVGLLGMGKAASSSKWSMVDEQRRLAWT